MSIKAPFRFARISRWVHTPAWGALATHDIPFCDGLSGQATITLTAITPLMIGGEPRAAANGNPGEVFPFRINGNFAIAPSTMQGHCRALLEIAAFGRLGTFVDERRFGIRDLQDNATAKVHYQSRLSSSQNVNGRTRITPKTMAGYLVRGKDGKTSIIPCEMARIHVNAVFALRCAKLKAMGLTAETENPFTNKNLGAGRRFESNARQRYEAFLDRLGGFGALAGKFAIDKTPEPYSHKNDSIEIIYKRCQPSAGPTATDGILVLTGKQSRGTGSGKKKWEFIFYDPDPSKTMDVDKSIWDAFEFIHAKQRGRDINPNWAFWKDEFNANKPIPIFYWTRHDGSLDTFGMAYAFKAAHTQSTHDLLKNSSPDHTTPLEEAPLDMPGLIFGVAAEGNKGRGLKRRAWFGPGLSDSKADAVTLGPVILLGPKPSFVGIYVRQGYGGDAAPNRQPLASYSPALGYGAAVKNPELAGVKLWPASYEGPATPPMPPLGGLAGTWKVQNILHAAPHSTCFTMPLTFHNLRPVELGALLWALSFGDKAAFGEGLPPLHHRLGMGKPVKLGEVAIQVKLEVDDDPEKRSEMDFVKLFEDHMKAAYGNDWKLSKQVQALLKAADPKQNTGDELKYMPLGGQNDQADSYIGEKRRGGFLCDYVDGDEKVRPNPPSVAPARKREAEPVLGPVNGARIRFHANVRAELKNKEGVIVQVGNGPYADHRIGLDNRTQVTAKQSLFAVISRPE